MFKISVRLLGPLFDFRARRALKRAIEEAKQEVAQTGVDMIQERLDVVLKTQTPYYRTQIQVERAARDLTVTDGDVVYGAWLEGVSERNQSTRFKGYKTFRIITRELQVAAPEIADRVIFKYTGEMN